MLDRDVLGEECQGRERWVRAGQPSYHLSSMRSWGRECPGSHTTIWQSAPHSRSECKAPLRETLEGLVQSRQELRGTGMGGRPRLGIPSSWDLKASPGGRTLETLTPDIQVEVLLRAAGLVQGLTGVASRIPHLHLVHLASESSKVVSPLDGLCHPHHVM